MTATNSNIYPYHICIVGQGGMPKVDPTWTAESQVTFDPASSVPLPFIMGVDVAMEHEGAIFDRNGDCMQVFNVNPIAPQGGWHDPHGVEPITQREEVMLEFFVEFDRPLDFGSIRIAPVVYVRHGGCFLDGLEINGVLCKPMPFAN